MVNTNHIYIIEDKSIKKGDKKNTESYSGGEKSGMAVENPDDIMGIVDKAKNNSKNKKEEEKKPDVEIRITLFKNGF